MALRLSFSTSSRREFKRQKKFDVARNSRRLCATGNGDSGRYLRFENTRTLLWSCKRNLGLAGTGAVGSPTPAQKDQYLPREPFHAQARPALAPVKVLVRAERLARE